MEEGAPEMAAEMMADEMQPMMENMEEPEKQASEKQPSEKQMSEKAMSEMERQSTAASEESEDERFCSCCCCLCDCSERMWRDLSCCGCFPVQCGIYAIGIFALFATFVIFVETFMMLLSDHIAWWYVGVSVLIQIPLIIGLIFFLNFFGEDTDSTRGKLKSALILAEVSFSLQVAWNIGYFWGLYKQQLIVLGNEDSMYTYTINKKMYLFWTTLIYAWVSFFFGYSICVVSRYAYRRRNRDEDNKEENMGDDMENNMTPNN
jgi:hypothetical protein